MNDAEESAASHDEEKLLEGEIEKEVKKLKYFLEETDDLIQLKDYVEMEIANKRADRIIDKLADLISQAEELKIDNGASSRSVRQWKKDVKSRYATLMADKERLSKILKNRKDEMDGERERRRSEAKEEQQRQEEQRSMKFRERQEEQERRMWQEKMEAELEVTRRKLELEKGARTTTAKLPKLKITPFKGTPTDWIGFRNMFVTQVHKGDKRRGKIWVPAGNGQS